MLTWPLLCAHTQRVRSLVSCFIRSLVLWDQEPTLFLKRFYLFIFRQRRREGERKGEKHQCAVASRVPWTGDLACNPDMCPDWESNQQPFGSQAGVQSTEPHQPGQDPTLMSSFNLNDFHKGPNAVTMGVMASAYESGGDTNISKNNWLIKQLQCDWVAKKLRKHFLGKLHVITYLIFCPLLFLR